jgi:hypothetical protein
MKALSIALVFACITSATQADDLNFSSALGKRLKTEVSTPGVPSVNTMTWTATCRVGIAISGYCASKSGKGNLQAVGADGPQWVCTWSEPMPEATATALCLFEE